VSRMKDFRNIADEIMSDINANNELKEKTLMRCMGNRRIGAVKYLVSAACLAIFLAVLNISGILPFKVLQNNGETPEINLMSGPEGSMETLPGKQEINPGTGTDMVEKWQLDTPEEAGESFGSGFLIPTYTAEGFRLDKIYAAGYEVRTADKIILNYSAGDRSYLIIEEKTVLQGLFEGFETVDINGSTGYIKPDASDDSGSSDIPDTELHWYQGGVHYSVAGIITRDEAISVAVSMK